MKVRIVTFIIVLLLLAVSCDYAPKRKTIMSIPNESGINDGSLSNFTYDTEKDVYYFQTLSNSSNTGHTYWVSIGDLEDISFTVKQTSGSANVYYGIIFLKEGMNTSFSFNLCMINIEGQYFISNFKNGENTYLVSKTESSALNKGLNQKNKISVTFDKDSREYTVLLNEELVYTGTYDKDDITGLKYGIIASVPAFDSSEERIEFKESLL